MRESILQTLRLADAERYEEKAIAFHKTLEEASRRFSITCANAMRSRSVKLPMANGNEGSKTALGAVQAATVRSSAADPLKGGAGPGDLGNLIVSCKLQGREV